MKLFIIFVVGALTGAFVLWFGFSKEVLTLNNRLVVVDRFTGKANRVFVSWLEAEQLERAESRQIENLNEHGVPNAAAESKPSAKVPEWRELTEAEIKQLEFEWRIDMNVNHGAVFIKYHNPFEQPVRIEKVRIQIPAKNGHAAIDREYENEKGFCPPQADTETLLFSLKIPANDFYELTAEEVPKGSGEDPFGAPGVTTKKAARHLVGTVTPSRALIQQ